VAEQLSMIAEWRYKIYLTVGNMNDILNMSFHDFKNVINQMIYENKPPEHRIRKLTSTQKGMIEKLKQLRKR
jgi:hypothetical protein